MKTKNLLLIVSLFFALSACKQKKSVETESIVKEWIGKTMELPDIEPISIDTLTSVKEFTNDYKILFYVDSTGCTSCKLRLHLWRAYTEELKDKADFLFYFQPRAKKDTELQFLLKQEHFTYPVFFDYNDELNKINKLPAREQFQCFLLDKNNKVLSIGNPAYNHKIWELYKQIIVGNISDTPPVTTVEPEQSEIEVKDMKLGKTYTTTFNLKNTGNNPMIIKNIMSSCGCTIPAWDKKPISPGKNGKVKVEIKPDATGYFRKTITVYCNTDKEIITLVVKGMVE